MLEKTLALLADVPPGTWLPDDAECFDPAELDELGHVLRRLLYSPSSIRRLLQQSFGVTLTRADAFGELPSIADLERSFASPSLLTLDGIFPANPEMLTRLKRLAQVSHEFNPPQVSSRPGEFAWQNGSFSYSDAMAYYAMIRTNRPRTIVEVGGGWHTAVALTACTRNGLGRIVCIEPDPGEFLLALEGIEVIRRPVRELDGAYFNSLLRDGDILFIDSSHAVRHDGDCLHLYLRILPELDAAISVQVHDINLPDTLSLEQMRDRQVFWNEQYLLYAYMCGNPRTKAMYGSRYHTLRNPGMLEQFMHGRYRPGGASFWFQQDRAAT